MIHRIAPLTGGVLVLFAMNLPAEGKTSTEKSTRSGESGCVTKVEATAKENTDTLTIVGRLTEIMGKFPPNDLYNYVYIMKYRVISVTGGEYDKKEILVGHYNPLIPRKRIKDKMDRYVDGDLTEFRTGEKHRLVLISPIEKVWKNAIEDEYFDNEDPRYFALQTDPVK